MIYKQPRDLLVYVTCLYLAFVLFCLDHHPLHTACKHVYILSIQKAGDMACKYNMHLADATAHVLSPTQTGHCGVQNPVNSVVWLVANYSLLAPLTTFAQDIQRFAIPLPERKPQLLLAVTFMVLAYLAILCGPALHANIFHLYQFPVSFRLHAAGVVLAQFCVCAALLICVRQSVDRFLS